jgi:protein TonB
VKLARRVTPPPVATPPPPEPLDLPPPVEEPPAPATRRVRVVGLSLSSTVSTGGPAFAVGNSRLGQTAEEAAAPGDGAPLAPDVRAPRRTSAPEPEYPPELRAQGLEGDVGLEVRLDAQGAIADVRVVTPSAFAAFARAAVESARRGVYEPATTNGTAQPYTLRFTVRFRLRKSEGLR